MESFYWKKSKKISNKSAAITEAICQMCHTKWESAESTSSERYFLLSMPKKSLSGTKITWTELLDQKISPDKETTPNHGTLAYYEDCH